MQTKVLFMLLTGCVVALTAWLVHVPSPAHAVDVPEKYRDVVSKGLDYLVKNQHKDGHWEGDDGKHPVAMTGLVGLALWMERSTLPAVKGRLVYRLKYAAEINKAVDWLIARSRPERDGLIFSEHPSETARYMEGHGLATIFLAAVHETEADDARRRQLDSVLNRAVKYIVKAQSSGGGWYHTSKMEGHDLDVPMATAIQLQALQAEAACRGVGGSNSAVVSDAQSYLRAAAARHETAGPSPIRRTVATAALVCWFNGVGGIRVAGEQGKDDLSKKWLKYCQAEIPVGPAVRFGRDELTHYYYAQAVCQLGSEEWSKYRTVMFDHLQSTQNKDGSWPAPATAEEGISVGAVYAAALWCTILQLDKGSHPSVPRFEMIKKNN